MKFFYFLFLLSPFCYSQKAFTPLESFNNDDVSIRVEKITKTSKYVWVKRKSKIEYDDYGIRIKTGFKHILCYFKINCIDKNFQIVETYEYDFDGNVISSSKTPVQIDNIIPDSFGELIFYSICK